jgi:UDP-N-acetylmuramoyl-L-alanyl-D-glutamate--2,6-diaminopimelate ligase
MKLSDLLEGLKVRYRGENALGGLDRVEIADLCDDSRKAAPGTLFIATIGGKTDGHRFAQEAIRKGAVAVVAERPAGEVPRGVVWVEVEDSRKALVRIAQRFFGCPERDLRLVGVTGTNGKTTTSFLAKAILERGGRERVGIIGTVLYDAGEGPEPASNTTPGALALRRLFRRMRDHGIGRAVMEVSSHALDQDRVAGCRFATAVFTNLTQDHLDYHGTMEDYFRSKQKLFLECLDGTAVVNIDDPFGARLAERLSGGSPARVLTYGLKPPADLFPSDLAIDRDGIRMRIEAGRERLEFFSPLMGRYNACNLLAGVGIGLSEGISPEEIVRGIERMRAVPGRFERIEEGQEFRVIVDYAHTEDALERLLEAAAALQPRRLLTLFGCGGDRDRGKRAKMGRVAARLSDRIILTSDNPRSEDPREIIREIEEGIASLSRETGKEYNYEVVVDRREAIERLLAVASGGDVAVIAGKGHEREQTVGSRTIPFDDREVARETLRKILK